MKEMVAEDRRLRASGVERAKVKALVLPTARFVRPLEADQRKVAVIPTPPCLIVGDHDCSASIEQRFEERGRGSKAGAQECLDSGRKIDQPAAGCLA